MTRKVMRYAIAMIVVAAIWGTDSASAQSGPAVRGYVTWGSTWLSAADTFAAIAGTNRTLGIGGGVAVDGLWRGLFVDAGMSQRLIDGQRVFVHNGTVFELGIPSTIRLRPIDVAAGWRFGKPGGRGSVSPYVGAGVTFLTYRETDSFAAPSDEVTQSERGWLGMGGVDVGLTRWLSIGANLRYRQVPSVLGIGGVSRQFAEDDLGGFSTTLRVSVGG